MFDERDEDSLSRRGRGLVLCGLIVAWAGAALAVGAFFLPWVRIEQAMADGSSHPLRAIAGELAELGKVDIEIRQGDRTVTGAVPDLSTLPGRASGFEIPSVANRSDVIAAVAFTEMLTDQRSLGKKSYLVYLLPCLAVAVGSVLTGARRFRWPCLFTAIACLLAAGLGFLKLSHARPQLLTMTVRIEPGLWLSCMAYVMLAVGALALSWSARRRSLEREEPSV